IVAGIVVQPWWQHASLAAASAGAVAGWLLVAIPSALWAWRNRTAGFGAGDRDMAALIGAFLGSKGVVGAFVWACGAALAYWLVLRLVSASPGPMAWRIRAARELGRGLPFGSCLAVGAVVMTFEP
ncbi:MAG: hypothetical protein MI919_19435, partial [Holophagales bacterium]|nr:hypothetical protein [Holophagales bacterium]